MLSKSVTSIDTISKELGIPYETVRNDIRYLKEEIKPWLYEVAADGYAFDCKNAIEKLARLERELEDMLAKARDKDKPNNSEIIAIMRELRATTLTRLNIEAEGPTLMTLRRVIKGEFLSEAEQKESEKKRKEAQS